MTIGEKIRIRRTELGWSQQTLADKMGYTSKSTIARIEKGYNDVAQKNIVKFSEVLGVSIAYLMDWEEEPTAIDSGQENIIKTVLSLNDYHTQQLLDYAKFLKSQEADVGDHHSE